MLTRPLGSRNTCPRCPTTRSEYSEQQSPRSGIWAAVDNEPAQPTGPHYVVVGHGRYSRRARNAGYDGPYYSPRAQYVTLRFGQRPAAPERTPHTHSLSCDLPALSRLLLAPTLQPAFSRGTKRGSPLPLLLSPGTLRGLRVWLLLSLSRSHTRLSRSLATLPHTRPGGEVYGLRFSRLRSGRGVCVVIHGYSEFHAGRRRLRPQRRHYSRSRGSRWLQGVRKGAKIGRYHAGQEAS
jgi:hypothetical protein